MLGTIAVFELRQRLRRISTYVYFVVMLAIGFLFALISGGAFSHATVDFGTGGRVLTNSPYALLAIIVTISTFGVVITAALSGQATYQDIDNNSTSFFYTAPISKFDYLAGRLLGSLAIQLFIFAAIGLGAWMGIHTYWVDPVRIGPERLLSYIAPYLMFVVPNLLITGAVFFAVAALNRKMLPVYIGAVVFLIGYVLANALAGDVTNSVTASLLDLFGGNAVDHEVRYWTPFQRNTQIVPFTGLVVVNRILWLAFAIAILLFAYSRFKMAHVVERGKGKQQIITQETTSPDQVKIATTLHPSFSFRSSLALFFSLTWLQFSEVLKSVFFIVIAVAGYSFSLFFCFNLASPFATPVYPVTYRMIELAGGGFGIFALAIITLYAGELVWRERDAGVDQIVDATPAQRWLLFGSKLATLMMVQVILEMIVMAAGLTTQISLGYHRFEFSLYFRELFVDRLLIFWVLCVFTLAVHAIVNNKYLGHFVVVLYYLVVFVLPGMGWEDLLYRFGQLPAFQYSDMNGYSPFVSVLFWIHLYWGVAAIMLAVLANLFWVRGTDVGWKQRRQLYWQRLSAPSAIAFSVSLLLFIALGGWIYYNTHILNNYVTANRLAAQRAEYEKKYRNYVEVPQPKVTDETLQVDLFPEQQRMNFAGTLWLENKTSQNVDQIALTIWPQELQPIRRAKIEIDRLSFSSGRAPVPATQTLKDDQLGFYVYQLSQPLPPHGRIALEFALKYAFRGFANSQQIDLVENGTFVTDVFAPLVGYQTSVDLEDEGVRHKFGLSPMKVIPKLEDVAARQQIYDIPSADWINSETTISTSPDQIAIAPGYLEKEWMENGRRYFHYRMDVPTLPGTSVNSARYQVLRDRWHTVNLEIYYDPQHTYDLERMRQSMKDTLDYCTENFSSFQFRQLRILEFPRYQTFAESFPNTIPFSESIGFITRVGPTSLNLPYFVTAHEIAHQWWGHQVITANTEGATMPVESLAEYTALMVMKHHLPPESMKKFMRRELDRYLFGRSQERTEERPLLRVTFNQAYIHYSKGALVMYALQDYIGEDKINQALAAYVKDFQFKGPPYPTSLDLENHLRKVTPPEFQYLYEDLFENITLYENRAKSGTYTRLPDGKYQVNLAVELKKFRADGKGEEHQIPAHDWVDIGVIDADGQYLYLQKHKIDGESADIQVIVNKQPYEAGIDPLNKLIDRKPDDNLVTVSAQ